MISVLGFEYLLTRNGRGRNHAFEKTNSGMGIHVLRLRTLSPIKGHNPYTLMLFSPHTVPTKNQIDRWDMLVVPLPLCSVLLRSNHITPANKAFFKTSQSGWEWTLGDQ